MCFGLEWWEHIIILVIVIIAIVSLIRLLVSFLLPKLGLGGEIVGFIVAAARIIIWAAVCIFAVIFIFELITCLLPYVSLGRIR